MVDAARTSCLLFPRWGTASGSRGFAGAPARRGEKDCSCGGRYRCRHSKTHDHATFDLDAYLARHRPCRAPRRHLRRSCCHHGGAHLRRSPSRTSTFLLGRRSIVDLAALQRSFVARRRGYCFEQNTLLRRRPPTRLVRGDAARRGACGSARLRPGPAADAHAPRRRPPLGRFSRRMGFGAGGPVPPAPAFGGARDRGGDVAVQTAPRRARLGLRRGSGDGWQDLYSFTEEPQQAVDFEVANWYTSTYRVTSTSSLNVQRQELHERRYSATRAEAP